MDLSRHNALNPLAADIGERKSIGGNGRKMLALAEKHWPDPFRIAKSE
jgi:hypothetical protein